LKLLSSKLEIESYVITFRSERVYRDFGSGVGRYTSFVGVLKISIVPSKSDMEITNAIVMLTFFPFDRDLLCSQGIFLVMEKSKI